MPESGHFTPNMKVNSQNQLWSSWEFVVEADPQKLPSVKECRENASRFFKQLFQTDTGRIRVFRTDVTRYTFQLQIEGPPAHDPDCQRSAKRKFIGDFMFKGFGYSASLVGFKADVISGSKQDGSKPEQLIAMPSFQTLLKGTRDG